MGTYMESGCLNEQDASLGVLSRGCKTFQAVDPLVVAVSAEGNDDNTEVMASAGAAGVSPGTKKKKTAERKPRDGVTSYLRAVASYSLLSAERERELAQVIRNGLNDLMGLVADNACRDPRIRDLLEKVCQLRAQEQNFPGVRNKIIKVITRVIRAAHREFPENPLYARLADEVDSTVARIDAVKQEMVRGNLRLVLSIAKRFRGRGLSFEDLVQEGNLGLMKAVVRYDHTKGNRFSTYATWWVRQSIIRGIYDKARTIRLPVHCIEQRNRFTKVFNELVHDLGRDPTLEEIAARSKVSAEKIQMILTHTSQHLSMETPVGEEQQRLGDLLVDEAAPSPVALYAQKELERIICLAMARLQPREEKILRLRFGIGGSAPKTLETIGREFGVSKERIRQIEKKALSKLRMTCGAATLLELWHFE